MKQLFYINSEQAEQTAENVLSMRIGERHFSFAVTDSRGDELHSLAYYTVDETNADTLSRIYSDHQELHIAFAQVQVGYDHAGSALVPSQYHKDATGEKALLNAMCGNTIGSSINSEPVNEWQLHNIYAVPEDVTDWLGRIFPSHKYRHNYTLAMEMMPADPADHIVIDFSTDEFSFIIINESKLQIAQTLSYSSPEDILYYLLKACNEFSLSRGEIQLYVSGLIEKDSQLFKELYQYFLNTKFRESTWKTHGAEENGYPAHFFTSLNDVARCAS